MQTQCVIHEQPKGNGFYIASEHSADKILEIIEKEWDTAFFGRKTALLQFNYAILKKMDSADIKNACRQFFSCVDHKEYQLIEAQIDIKHMPLIPVLEEFGFRFVDSKITFITLIKKLDYNKKYPLPFGQIRFADKKDTEQIVAIAEQGFTDNPNFFSRYKNFDYYTLEQSKDYYSAWIRNYIQNEKALFAVIETDGKIAGFFIYEDKGLYQGKKLYKGILASVLPEYQGHRLHLVMQSFLYDQIGVDEFYVDNTTQLSNSPTIKNHMTSKKQLSCIELIFYRS